MNASRRLLTIVAKRFLVSLPTLLLVSLGVFVLLEVAPGDAADAYLAQTGGDAGFAEALRQTYGLDASFLSRILRFYRGLATGDLGASAIFNRPVLSVILERIPTTLALMSGALAFTAIFGSLLGLISGAKPGGPLDHFIMTITLGLLAIPNFWLALLLILWFGVHLGWLPIAGLRNLASPQTGFAAIRDVAQHLVLPTIALGAGYLAIYVRTWRAGMVAMWRQDHVRSARARGLKSGSILWRGVARPALSPVVALLGQQAGTLFGGSVVIETVFAIPGLGRLAYEAVAGRDALLLAGVVLFGTCVVIFANLVADLVLVRLDPRMGATDG